MILTNFGSIPSSGGSLWLDGWSYGKKITIPANSIDADLTNFPATVYLNNSNFDFSKAKADGSDIRFTDKNLNQLKFERKEFGNYIIYKNGVENSPLGTFAPCSNSYGQSKSQTKNSDNLYLTCTASSVDVAYISYVSTNTVDFQSSGIKKLRIVYTSTVSGADAHGAILGVNTANNSRISTLTNRAQDTTPRSTKTNLDLDVSSLVGSYYIYVGVGSGPSTTQTCNCYEVYGLDANNNIIHLNQTYNVLVPTVSDLIDTEIYMWYGNANAYNTSIEAWQDQTGKQLTYNGNVKLVHGVQTGKRVASFDGSGDYLTLTDSNDWTFGNGDFTVEWIENRTASVVNNCVIGNCGSGGTGSYMYFGYHTSGTNLNLYLSSNNTSWDIANAVLIGTYDIGIKNHFSVTRSGNTFRTFKNGVKISEFTSTATIMDSPNLLRIGTDGSSTYCYTGYLDGIRITKGRARYTSNFTPPTTFSIDGSDVVFCTNFDTIYDANYVMVQHMGDTLVDASGNGKNLTQTGTVSTINSDYGKCKSATWNTSNYLGNTAVLGANLGTGNVSILSMMKKSTPPTTDYSPTLFTLGKNSLSTNARLYFIVGKTNGNGTFQSFDGNTNYIGADSVTNVANNTWHSVCGIRNGTTIKVNIDGTTSASNTGTTANIAYQDFRFGNCGDSSFDNLGDAYIGETRVSTIARSDAWIKAESLALKNSLITMVNL